MERQPPSLRRCFWDIAWEDFQPARRPRFVIERVLEYGDADAADWMMRSFPRAEIAAVLKKSRALTPKSAAFWALVFALDKEDIRCLNRSFRKTRKLFWPH